MMKRVVKNLSKSKSNLVPYYSIQIYVRIFIKKEFKNNRFSHITMAQERALQDTNTTNVTSPINFYQNEKKKKKIPKTFL